MASVIDQDYRWDTLMGPISLFDKSFLQSLSQDESVWFDHFFLPNVCPIFYLETQADLAKGNCGALTPDDYVRRISDKFPDYSGSPNTYHATMVTANLLGEEVPVRSQVIVPNGCRKIAGSHSIAIIPESPEAKAFLRWSNGQFAGEERQAASAWRTASIGIETAEVIRQLQQYGAYRQTPCPTLREAKETANATLARLSPRQQLTLAFGLLGAYAEQMDAILIRFAAAGDPPLSQFAPYAEFALEVEIFYHLAVHKGRMSAAHRMDVLYLFYLPFCDIFVSCDWVHRDCAPLFMRADQDFVLGPQLKNALRDFNSSMTSLGDVQKSQSILELARRPPLDGDSLVAKLWDRHHPSWRTSTDDAQAGPPECLTEIGPPLELPEDGSTSPTYAPDAVMRFRAVRKKKGSWWRVPQEYRGS